jgi:hypothetical protein
MEDSGLADKPVDHAGQLRDRARWRFRPLVVGFA